MRYFTFLCILSLWNLAYFTPMAHLNWDIFSASTATHQQGQRSPWGIRKEGTEIPVAEQCWLVIHLWHPNKITYSNWYPFTPTKQALPPKRSMPTTPGGHILAHRTRVLRETPSQSGGATSPVHKTLQLTWGTLWFKIYRLRNVNANWIFRMDWSLGHLIMVLWLRKEDPTS